MPRLLLTFYGDDFTGSTDALEQLTLAGIRAALFIQPPTPTQLKQFPGLQAIGVAGNTRALVPAEIGRVIKPAFVALKKLGARHVHYKVCSTFDSSPEIGSIGHVLDMAVKLFPGSFIPLVAAAPSLGRYTVFGNHFARFGIGSDGEIHRLDRHPSISGHPVTPMLESDLRLHLAKQTKKKIALFDVLKAGLPVKQARDALKQLLTEKPDVVLFDALTMEHIATIGALLDRCADEKSPLFSIGSSGIEAALATAWKKKRLPAKKVPAAKQILVGSGSCSPVTSSQVNWALKHGFAEVSLAPSKLANSATFAKEIDRAATDAANYLQSGRSVIVHTTKNGPNKRIAAKLKGRAAEVLGSALGNVLLKAIGQNSVQRVCVAGGDTSSYAARAMGIEALEMIAPLTPGAPLCRVKASASAMDGLEVVFKGGQVGAQNYFEIVKNGNA